MLERWVLKKEIFNMLMKKAISLEKYGLNDLAWKKEDALELIKSLMTDPIGVLGGDVYKINGDRLIPLYDNWSCDPNKNEGQKSHFQRSKFASIKYIENYPIHSNEEIVFSITFTEHLVL